MCDRFVVVSNSTQVRDFAQVGLGIDATGLWHDESVSRPSCFGYLPLAVQRVGPTRIRVQPTTFPLKKKFKISQNQID